MRIYALRLEGIQNANKTPLAYVSDYHVALVSLKITFSAFENVTFKQDAISITVIRSGFDPVRYVLEPLDLLLSPEHL